MTAWTSGSARTIPGMRIGRLLALAAVGAMVVVPAGAGASALATHGDTTKDATQHTKVLAAGDAYINEVAMSAENIKVTLSVADGLGTSSKEPGYLDGADASTQAWSVEVVGEGYAGAWVQEVF
jgi:hypothetical protein